MKQAGTCSVHGLSDDAGDENQRCADDPVFPVDTILVWQGLRIQVDPVSLMNPHAFVTKIDFTWMTHIELRSRSWSVSVGIYRVNFKPIAASEC